MVKERIAIMQPYFYPYIGYFHLLAAVDVFVLYDNIQYTKKGWINRNRFLRDGCDVLFSIPLKKASDYCDVNEREVSDQFDRFKLTKKIGAAYRKAPFFTEAMELFTRAIECPESNLFLFIKHSLVSLCQWLGIKTTIIDSSSVAINHTLRGQEKVQAICGAFGVSTYVNAMGGRDLYDDESFRSCGIQLKFVHSVASPYPQFDHPFVPWLSILDMLMFNSRETIRGFVHNDYSLFENVTAES